MPDPLTLYIREVEKVPLLSAEEEIKCARQIIKGDVRSRKKMIQSNLRLVISIAKRFSYLGVPMMDLIEEGNLGLMHAVGKFDPERGYRFSTYAAWWIKQYVTRAIGNQGKTIRIPVYMNEKLLQLKKITEELTHKYRRKPKLNEIAKKMNISLKQLQGVKSVNTETYSLDTPIGEDGTSQLVDMIEDPNSSAVEDNVSEFLRHEKIESLMMQISERERKVLDSRYGLKDGQARTLSEVAKIFGISRERIRQIESNALKKLKKEYEQQEKSFSKGDSPVKE